MTNSERRNWMDNLQNAAQEACKQSGVNTVTCYLLQHYGVSSLEELSTTDYDRVFDYLDFYTCIFDFFPDYFESRA